MENNYGLKKFYYDDYGNLTKATYSDGSSETWTYKQPFNLLASYCDRDSVITSFEYDPTGFLTTIKRGGKTIVSYEGNGWGGVLKSHGFDEEVFDYDTESYALTKDKSGRYEYDSQGRIIIPPSLRDHAGITKEVVVVGNGSKAMVWDRKKYEEVFADMDDDAFVSDLIEQYNLKI